MTWGSATTYHSYQAKIPRVQYYAREKIVLTYADTNDSNKGILLVGTVNSSNNTITGTAVDFNYNGGDNRQMIPQTWIFDPDTAEVYHTF